MLSVFLLICIATPLHFWPTEGAGVSRGSDCVIESHFKSPLINAYFERVALVTGCVSTERGPQSQEVHVVSLIGGYQSFANSAAAEVTLHIKPHSSTGTHEGPLIFVLNSHHPVKWIIQAERITNQTKHKFVIRSDSRLEKDKSVKIKIKKEDLPFDTEGLAAWTRKNYRALTSFAEVDQANTFLKKVGRDDSAPSFCNISANFFDPSSTASYLQPQPMAGCVAIANVGKNERDVHIIELTSGNLNWHNQQEANIFLDIKTKSKPSRSNNKKITLVLKTHNPIRWHIRTRGVRNMVVMTDQPVEMVHSQRPKPQSVTMTREIFGERKGEELIRRVQEGEGPIVSYTNMRLANRIDLFLDGAQNIPPYSGHLHRLQDMILKSPFDNPGRTKNILSRAKMVTCGDHGITVVFKKMDLKLAGIRQEHLSFKNTSCIARSNETHFVLHSGRDECSTQILSESDLANSILVNRIDETTLDLDDDDGSAISADMYAASGYLIDDTHIDDEDYSSSATSNTPITVPFECRVESDLPLARIEDSQHLSYSLEAFFDSHLSHVITYPYHMNDYMLFVRAKVYKEFEGTLQARIDTCWLSEFNRQNDESEFLLIDQGCPVGDSVVHWLPADAAFSLNLARVSHPLRISTGFLKCNLTVCGKESTGVISRCRKQEDYCRHRPVLKSVQMKTLGPLHFMNVIGRLIEPTNQPLQRDECQPVSPIEGLDSATVVGIAFATFIIGVLLTAALWFIHTHTGPMRKQNRPRSTETSGESTPSSTAPITIHQIHT